MWLIKRMKTRIKVWHPKSHHPRARVRAKKKKMNLVMMKNAHVQVIKMMNKRLFEKSMKKKTMVQDHHPK
jgi:hypothetical protein